jgi:flavodoxin
MDIQEEGGCIMSTLVVYYSQFGNTKKVAEAIGDVLQQAGTGRTISIEELTAADLEGIDLVVMGSPTHKMNLPEAVRPVFDELPKRALRGVAVVAFDTSYQLSGFLARMTAARRLDRKLRKLGGKRLLAPETFFVKKEEGYPLYDGEIERARDWAREIVERLGRQAG